MADITRNIFSLSEYSDDTTAGEGVPIPSVWTADSAGDNAYVGGGSGPSASTVMDKLTFTTGGIARVPSADLNNGWGSNAAPFSAASAGYFAAGNQGTPGSPGTIDRRSYVRKLTYSTETISNANPINYSPSTNGQGPQGQGGTMSATAGYVGGGSGGGGGDEKSWVSKMSFSNETWSGLPRLPSAIHYQGDALGNLDAGYWCGGSPGVRTMVQKVTYSTDTTSRNPGSDLVSPGRYFAGAGNADAGFLMGRGSSPSAHSNIFKFTYASGTTSLHPSNLPTAVKQARGTGNLSAGYAAGGEAGPGSPVYSTVTKLDYSTGTPSYLGALTAGARNNVLAVSARDHGAIGKAAITRWEDDWAEGKGYAVEFDGATDGDALSIPDFPNFDTENFTVECWIYPHTITGGICTILDTAKKSNGTRSYNGGWWALHQNNGGFYWGRNSANPISTSSNLSVNTWYHVAFVRNGDANNLYLNGTSIGSFSETPHNYFDGHPNLRYLSVGRQDNPGSGRQFDGLISNVRIVRGEAIYTANFTPTDRDLTTTSQGVDMASNVKLICCNKSTVTGSTVTTGPITTIETPTIATQTVVGVWPPTATPTLGTVDEWSPSLSNDGYWLGGKENPGPSGNKCGKIQYATDTVASLPNLPYRAQFQGGMSSTTHGYSVAGYDEVPDGAARYKSNVTKVEYSTDTMSGQGTYPAGRVQGLTGVSAGTNSHGYCAGGANISNSNDGGRSSIQKFTFATGAWATIPDKLAQDLMPNTPTPMPVKATAGGNREYGYWVAANSSTNPNRYGQMTRITYATDTTLGNLPRMSANYGSTGMENTSTSSSGTAMYTIGNWLQPGPSPSKHSTLFEKWTFSSDTSALLPSSSPGLSAMSSSTASGNWEGGYHIGGGTCKKIVYATDTTTQNPSLNFSPLGNPHVYSEGVAESARDGDGGKVTNPVVC